MDWSKKEGVVKEERDGSFDPVAYRGAGAVTASCSLDEVVDWGRGLYKGLCYLVHNCICHPAIDFKQLLT